MHFRIPTEKKEKLKDIIERAEKDEELETYLRASNMIAIDRLGYSDHGPTHIKLVANIGLKILRLLTSRGVKASVVRDYGMTNEDAEVIVFLSSVLHDIGHSVHREKHEDYSVPLAIPLIDRFLKGTYNQREATIIKTETLHAMVAHQREMKPLTIEAGILRVADALDMKKGRARIPFQAGEVNIHSVSALAVENVAISAGVEKPVLVRITLSNSSGIFQIDEMLKKKMEGTLIRNYINIEVKIEGEWEKRIIDELNF